MTAGVTAISAEELSGVLQSCLHLPPTARGGLEDWKAFLLEFRPDPARRDDPFALLACALALRAVCHDTFGVGALLVDPAGRVVVTGHNQIFFPHFRSDLHAEMVVLDRWEDSVPPETGGFTLYTSLEPCPMCTVRLSTSRVERVHYVTPDPTGGMASRISDLPPFWREFAARKMFSPADCSPELAEASTRILNLSLQEMSARIV